MIGVLSVSSYLLTNTLKDEYCSCPSISAGSLKPSIEILYSLLVEVPWAKVWNLNSCFDPFPNPDWINGVEAYEYPSVCPKPLNTKLALWVINSKFEPEPSVP